MLDGLPAPLAPEPLSCPIETETVLPIEAFVAPEVLSDYRNTLLPVPISHYESKQLFNPTIKILQPLMGEIKYYPVPISHYADMDMSKFLRHNQADYLAIEFIFEEAVVVPYPIQKVVNGLPAPVGKVSPLRYLRVEKSKEIESVVSNEVTSEVSGVVTSEVSSVVTSEVSTKDKEINDLEVTTLLTTPVTTEVTTLLTTPRKSVKDVVIEVKAIEQNGVPKLKYIYYRKNKPYTAYYTLSEVSRKISSYKTKLKQTTNELALKNRKEWYLFWVAQRKKLKAYQLKS